MGTFAGGVLGAEVDIRKTRTIRRGVKTIAIRNQLIRLGWGAGRCVMRLLIRTLFLLLGRHSRLDVRLMQTVTGAYSDG